MGLDFSQMETELNEKLRDCWEKLLQTDADRRESEREVKLKETLTSLQRIFPGMSSGSAVSPSSS